MIRITVHDAAGATNGTSHIAGDWRLASETPSKLTWTGRVVVGPFAGATMQEEWLGTFNSTTSTGRIREIRQSIGSDLHFSKVFEPWVRTDYFDADYAAAAAGGVEFFGNSFNNAVAGDVGNDRFYGYAGNDAFMGDSGNDYLNGGAGLDWMEGGVGNDTYVVDNSRDRALELPGEGTDRVVASISYTLPGNVENLTLGGAAAINGTGNALANAIAGNAAANLLNGGAGADRMSGGRGDDVYVRDNAGDVIVELASQGVDRVNSRLSFTLVANVENLTLIGAAGIAGTGNASANVIIGNAADNTLRGLAGNDTLNGAAGADRMEGGLGNDVYVRDNAGDVIVELAGQGVDRVNSSLSHILAANVENLLLTGTAAINGTGNALANAITGNAAANLLNGGAGADRMSGGRGDDVYVRDNAGDVIVELAGQGVDRVNSRLSHILAANVENLLLTGAAAINGTGNALANAITGNAAANLLNGGLGADRLVGGLGADGFVFASASHSVPGAARDVIADFARGADKVDLSRIDADSGSIANDAFAFIGASAFGGTPGELRFSAGVVAGDLNGDQVADFEIGIANGAALTRDDFVL